MLNKPQSEEELDSLRNRLTDLSIFIGLFAGLPIVGFKVYQTVTAGFDLSSWPSMAVYSIFGILAFLRHSIDYRIRAGISMSLMFLAIFFGMSHYGFMVAAFVASLASSVLAIFILGRARGMLFALVVSGIGTIAAFIVGNHTISENMDTMDAIELIVEWWPQLIAILAFYFSLTLSIILFESSLKKTVHQLEFQKRELQVLNKELIQSRDHSRRANEAKTQFISVMSHELKTPLNPIFGLLNLLKEEPLNEDSKEYVELMENSSKHLLSLIEDILDFVEVDQEKLGSDMHPTSVKEFCEELIEVHSTAAEQKNISLSNAFDFGDDSLEDIEILTDSRRLNQVMSSLISNAIKFTDKGSVHLNLSRKETSDSGCKLEFTVEDTGIGIPEELQQRIFEPFFQGVGSDTRKHGGIGLGLSVAVKIAQLLNGNMTFQSQEGKGSTFKLTIPCLYSNMNRTRSSKAEPLAQ